jgi:hypothetical protein
LISLGPHDSSLDFCCTGNASILKMMDSPGIKEHIVAPLPPEGGSSNSIQIIVDQAAINAGFCFRRYVCVPKT